MFIKNQYYFFGKVLLLVFFLSIAFISTSYADYQTNLGFSGYIQDSSGDIDVVTYSAPVVFDWNNDGKKDLLVGQKDNTGGSGDVHGYITYFENQGTNASPSFGNGTYIESCAPCSPLDVTADG